MKRYFFDTEFIEDGRTIDLISIGIVCEDGREFYAEVASTEIPWARAAPWVLANVRPHLRDGRKWAKADLGPAIVEFVTAGGDKPQFWAYVADYDWVVFCQLFGRMLDLPKGWPRFCMDLKQLTVEKGSPKLPDQVGTEHHALADARWNRDVFAFLNS